MTRANELRNYWTHKNYIQHREKTTHAARRIKLWKKGEKLIKREENFIRAHYVYEMKKCKKEEEK
jgi:hypothetical protein